MLGVGPRKLDDIASEVALLQDRIRARRLDAMDGRRETCEKLLGEGSMWHVRGCWAEASMW